MGEHAHGAVRSRHVAERVAQRHRRIAQVVAAAEAGEARPARDQPAAEQRRQLVEVEVGHAHAMAERVLAHREAAVETVPS